MKPSERVSPEHSHWLAGVKARYPKEGLKYRPDAATMAAYFEGEPVAAFNFERRKGWTLDPPHWPEK